MARYLVVGGAGRTGRRVAAQLASHGCHVRVLSRHPGTQLAGTDAVLHRGVAALAGTVASSGYPVVLVSQIYVTRPQAYPQMTAVTEARGRGEQALRDSGAPYSIVRPGWLHDRPATGVRLEQGDTGDGPVSRDTVAAACVAALLRPADGFTFEVFDDDTATNGPPIDWAALLGRLVSDRPAGAPHAH